MVGMHNHTYFNIGQTSTQMSFTGPRLNLAGGVTTIRTAGSRAPYNELNQQRAIELGQMPGPRMYTTGPYLNGSAGGASASVALTTPEDARRVVAYWAEEGASWLKFQGSVTREVLGAAIDEAHRHGIKVTGHLCSVTFREAAALGIDNLEHGLITNSDYISTKRPDVCPPENMIMQVGVDVYGDEVQATFRDLVAHDVALTSTLSVYELFVPSRATVQERVLDAMAPEVRQQYLRGRELLGRPEGGYVVPEALFEKMLQYEREFVNAGGLLAAGVDPWGNGSLPGYGDQRNYELLIEAGFSAAEAVQIMSANGAKVLGAFDRFGSIEVGKLADLAVIAGDLASDPSAINEVTLVFKDGVGFDSAKLIESVRGQVGIR
jgi:imidazolonepropionase-like amidohydrolase